MINIGGWISDVFGPYGALGILICVMLIFMIDALLFPTLPELFFVIGFMYDPTLGFGCLLLLATVIGEIIGICALYHTVERVKVPQRIRNVVDRYVNFLIVSDERLLLVNRVAPMIPFAGAFISIIDTWKLDRALFYVVVGCILKYGAITLMSSFFFNYFSSGAAQTYTIVFVILVMSISFIIALARKRRAGINENC